jgi:hypothetical protein
VRKYIITFTIPSEGVDPDFSVEDDLKALENGSLTVDDLVAYAKSEGGTVSYSVVEVEEN